ncbi:MAG TPA: hypothetical protein VEB42_07870, partial [Chitinophagaceae bacterium]|nr:hypothetical protein [Chitinophagaceae bacterium]
MPATKTSKKTAPKKTKETAPKNKARKPELIEGVPDLIKSCTVKLLPREQWAEAAQKAIEINPGNAPALGQFRMAFPDEVIQPDRLAVLTSKYWGVGGVRLTVSFMDNAPANLRARILSHMNAWGAFSNVQFDETAQNGQVRITRTPGGGYWSYLGTDVTLIRP